MASVNFAELKKGTVGAIIRHCSTDERFLGNHSNPHIDKTLTYKNRDFIVSRETGTHLTLDDTINRFRRRIEFLDKTTNTNHRSDRVECFSLEIPYPENVSDDWGNAAVYLLKDKYGINNLVNAYIHYDEVHEYKDRDQDGNIVTKKSRPHIHAFIVPEIDGKLNAKAFSSRSAMIRLNKEIDQMTRERFGVHFLTGEKARHQTVEQLKAESLKAEVQALELAYQEIADRIIYELNCLEARCDEIEKDRSISYQAKMKVTRDYIDRIKREMEDKARRSLAHHSRDDDDMER